MPAQRGEHTRERPLVSPFEGQRGVLRFFTEFQHVPPRMGPRRNQGGVEAGTPEEDEGAVLAGATGLAQVFGTALYDAQTDFTGAWADGGPFIPFDPVVAGWTFVPEPSTALLMALGLTALAVRREQ